MNRTITYPPQTPRYYNGGYRYFFNGQEADNEVLGDGALHAFEYRMHDTRIGRFWSVDPLAGKFPWNSVYAFAENSPIGFMELEGLEKKMKTTPSSTLETMSIRVVSVSDNAKVVPTIRPKVALRLQKNTEKIYVADPGEIRQGKSDYEKEWMFHAASFENTLRTNYVMQSTSAGIFFFYSWFAGEQVLNRTLPYAMKAGKFIKSNTMNFFSNTRVKIGIGMADGVVSYKYDLPPDISWPDPVVTFTSQITQLGVKAWENNTFFRLPETKKDTNNKNDKQQ